MDAFDTEAYEDAEPVAKPKSKAKKKAKSCDDWVCPTCKTKFVSYENTFSYGLSVFLAKLVAVGGVAPTDSLKLTYPQRTNSQKLRYWGLAKPHLNEQSKRKRGWWEVTEKGIAFAAGEITIPEVAVVRRNVVLRLEGKEITFGEAAQGYRVYADFVDQVRKQLGY